MFKLIIEYIRELIKIYKLKRYYKKILKNRKKEELIKEQFKEEEKMNRYFYKRFVEKK